MLFDPLTVPVCSLSDRSSASISAVSSSRLSANSSIVSSMSTLGASGGMPTDEVGPAWSPSLSGAR